MKRTGKLIAHQIGALLPPEPSGGIDLAWWWIAVSIVAISTYIIDVIHFITYPIWRPLVWVWKKARG